MGKTVCPKHEIAFDTDTGCPYCEPDAHKPTLPAINNTPAWHTASNPITVFLTPCSTFVEHRNAQAYVTYMLPNLSTMRPCASIQFVYLAGLPFTIKPKDGDAIAPYSTHTSEPFRPRALYSNVNVLATPNSGWAMLGDLA